MPTSATVERTLSAEPDLWFDENARGLAFAARGDWSNAVDAFRRAGDVVSTHTDMAGHEAQALILNNLAQASFRAGQHEDAVRHAQRACALRVALLGEDAIPVARARAELAVMLASMNKADEALGLIRRAISGIERSAGDDDIRLVSVLENAARLAMVAGQPSIAEPYLLRLHALLSAHEMSTEPAEVLLSRLTAFRVEQQVAAMESFTVELESSSFESIVSESPTGESWVDDAPAMELPMIVVPDEELSDEDVPDEEVPDEELPVHIVPTLELHAFEEYEDQPLRDAVVLTDVLLRSTPTSSRVIPPVAFEHSVELEIDAIDIEADTLAETPDLNVDFHVVNDVAIDVVDDVVTEGVTDTSSVGDVFGGSVLDIVDLQPEALTPVSSPSAFGMEVELDLVMDMSDADDAGLVFDEEVSEPAPEVDPGGLGFAVEYGAVSTTLDLTEEMSSGTLIEALNDSSSQFMMSGAEAPLAPLPVATPSSAAREATISTKPDTKSDTDSADARPTRQPGRKPVIRGGAPVKSGMSGAVKIGGVVLAAVAAGVAWFFTMGG